MASMRREWLMAFEVARRVALKWPLSNVSFHARSFQFAYLK